MHSSLKSAWPISFAIIKFFPIALTVETL